MAPQTPWQDELTATLDMQLWCVKMHCVFWQSQCQVITTTSAICSPYMLQPHPNPNPTSTSTHKKLGILCRQKKLCGTSVWIWVDCLSSVAVNWRGEAQLGIGEAKKKKGPHVHPPSPHHHHLKPKCIQSDLICQQQGRLAPTTEGTPCPMRGKGYYTCVRADNGPSSCRGLKLNSAYCMQINCSFKSPSNRNKGVGLIST